MEASCKRYLIRLAYDGTDFSGFQIQKDRRTVQGVVESALGEVCGEAIRIRYAGRTDAGVHAKAQFADFVCPNGISPFSLMKALNSLLPWDVRVMDVRCVPDSFHSRYDAIFREYTYLIYNAPVIPPFFSRYNWHVPGVLDVERMRSIKGLFEGEKNFKHLCDADSSPEKLRYVHFLRVSRFGNRVIINIRANGFLRGMVRYIVGILVGVAQNRLQMGDVESIIGGNYVFRPKAPPCGLFLSRVYYGSAYGNGG